MGLLERVEQNWEAISMIGIEAYVESRRLGFNHFPEYEKVELESAIDFLCWRYDRTGDMEYLKELKQLMKEY